MENKKYKLVVGSIFKNEENSIIEWIEHYLYHGVEHFYLIDDSSNDSSVEKIQEYIESGLITLFNYGNQWPKYLGRQNDMLNHYILPLLNETQWYLNCDIDEYVWSLIHVNISELLMKKCMHLGQIQMRNILIGSYELIEKPKNIICSFLMRSKKHLTVSNKLCLLKYFINTNFKFSHLNIHGATFLNKTDELKYFIIIDCSYFVLNELSYTISKFLEKDENILDEK